MKFECKQCGHCCKSFKDPKVHSVGLPIFEWEKVNLEGLAKEKGFQINIDPVNLMFDKRSGLYFCTLFNLNQEPCPFLKENKCSIYDNRPLVCRTFPLIKSPLLAEGGFDLSFFIHCENFNFKNFLIENLSMKEGEPKKLSKVKVIKEYCDVFGKELLSYSAMCDYYHFIVKKIMDKLVNDRKIKLRKVNRYDYKKYPALSFFDFLMEIGVYDKDNVIGLINELTDYKKREDEVNNFLKDNTASV